MEVQISEMSLAELRTLAKSRGIKSVSTLRKQELIDILGAGTESAEDTTDIAGKGDRSKEVERKKPAEIAEKAKKEQDGKEPEEKATSAQIKRNPRTEKDSDTRNSQSGQEGYTRRSYQGNGQGSFQGNQANNQAGTNGQAEEGRKSYWQTNGSQTAGSQTVGNQMPGNQGGNSQAGNSQAGNNQYGSNQDTDARRNGFASDTDVLDSGETKEGILEVMPDGYGFIRCDNYLPGENDVYVSPAQIRRFCLKTGDIVVGNTRIKNQGEKFSALLFVKSVNGFHPGEAQKRKKFEDLTPIFPNERIHLETPGTNVSMRMVDLVSPIGKGQRGMIVSQPKTGKTTLLKQIAKAITINHPGIRLIILLIDERPEEVTDIKESIEGKNVEVIYSTFDELPDNHKRVSEMVIERAKRLVEHKQDVVILLDSITRLARAYNLTVQASGRTLSGGLDPAALHMPKRFFGAARNMREGGSLTILATALVDTGSRMDDVVFEEFKGTGNMELVLDRNLSEKRIFPAIDLPKSSTRRDDLLLTQPEMEATYLMRKAFNSMKSDDAVEKIIDMFIKTKTNAEFIETVKKTKLIN